MFTCMLYGDRGPASVAVFTFLNNLYRKGGRGNEAARYTIGK